MGINKVNLIGNVGSEPETFYTTNSKVVKFSLATSETYKDKNGEKQTNTEWHNIVIWGKLADVVEKYVKKGTKLYLEGKITYRSYEKDGVKKYITEINCNTMEMLSKQESKNNNIPENVSNEETDDLPF